MTEFEYTINGNPVSALVKTSIDKIGTLDPYELQDPSVETELQSEYLWQFERPMIRKVSVTQRRNCERTEDATELLRSLSDAIDKIESSTPRKWLIDHVHVDAYGGTATAYLRPNI